MARFAEVRKHLKGMKRRAAKETASSNAARPASQEPTVRVAKVAVKPTAQRIRGRHLLPYELDPLTCDPRDLAMLAEDALDDLDGFDVNLDVLAPAKDEKAA